MTSTKKHGAKPGKITPDQRKPKTLAHGVTPATKPNQSFVNQLPARANVEDSQKVQSPTQQESAVSAPVKGLLTRMGTCIKKIAEVADRVDKIRNAIEGVYKLAKVLWPIFLLMWAN